MARSRFSPLPRVAPEARGVDPGAVAGFLREAEAREAGMHEFMLLRGGAVVAEAAWRPYRLSSRRKLYSLSKSFASTAVGLAVSEGRLSVEDPVLSIFPGKEPREASENLRAMKVKHLLTMTTGHATDSADRCMREADPVAAFLALPVEHEPGTRFVYDSGATFMLSAIVQRLARRRLSDYLRPRLFDRVGIEGARWDRHDCGVDLGAVGLWLAPEDIARFGLLYLRGGLWEGERVIPESWVGEATTRRVANEDPESPDRLSDWQQGYGYQFWMCRHGFYRGDGAFGQFCLVMPDRDAVLVALSGTADMQRALDIVWEVLLPGLPMAPTGTPDEAGGDAPSPAAGAPSFSTLPGSVAEGLALAPPLPAQGSAGGAHGLLAFRFDENLSGISELSFDFRPDRLELGYRVSRSRFAGSVLDEIPARPRGARSRRLAVGYGEWVDGTSWLDGEGPKAASCAGAWTGPDVFTLKVVNRETPKIMTLSCRFSADEVGIEISLNVNMGPTEFPPIVGRPA